jgi:hypothetical protein
MSVPSENNEGRVATNRAPIELRVLARLELKKHRLLEELAEVESLHRQFSKLYCTREFVEQVPRCACRDILGLSSILAHLLELSENAQVTSWQPTENA